MTELALRTTIVFASVFVVAAALRRAAPATDVGRRFSGAGPAAAIGIVLLTSSPMGPIDRTAIESGLTWAVNAALRAIR